MKVIVNYDIVAWESVDIDDFDELKDKCGKITSLLKGLGISSFQIRTGESNTEPAGEPSEQPTTN